MDRDEELTPFLERTGSLEIAGTAQLAGDSRFADKTKIDFYDAGGNLLFSACGAGTGLRFSARSGVFLRERRLAPPFSRG